MGSIKTLLLKTCLLHPASQMRPLPMHPFWKSRIVDLEQIQHDAYVRIVAVRIVAVRIVAVRIVAVRIHNEKICQDREHWKGRGRPEEERRGGKGKAKEKAAKDVQKRQINVSPLFLL